MSQEPVTFWFAVWEFMGSKILPSEIGQGVGIKGMDGRADRDGGGARRLSATESRSMEWGWWTELRAGWRTHACSEQT